MTPGVGCAHFLVFPLSSFLLINHSLFTVILPFIMFDQHVKEFISDHFLSPFSSFLVQHLPSLLSLSA